MNRQLLILDLDETLIFGTEDPLLRAADFLVGPYFVYLRPHVTQFVAAALDWFDVAVWSSAGDAYVDGIVSQIFPAPAALQFVWTRNRCTQRFNCEDQSHYWVKNLKKVCRLGYRLERVLVIDDSPEKLEMQYGNLLLLRPYVGAADDRELLDVLPYLNYLRDIPDLRQIEKRHWRSVPSVESQRRVQP